MNNVLDYLTHLFDKGLSYDTINIARCALSALGIVLEGFLVGKHPLISRFCNGVFKLRPPSVRYKETWDVNKTITYLKSLPYDENLTLKMLSLKLAMLIGLTQASRVQSLHLLTLQNLRKGSDYYVLYYSDSLKQCKPGRPVPYMKINCYTPDRRLCVFHSLQEYINRTSSLRNDENKLFISYMKPHKAVTTSTISRWIKTVMASSGIDVSVFKSHSVRSASTSKAKTFIPIKEILSVAGWRNARTFADFYDKRIQDSEAGFAETVLSHQ